MNTKKTVYFIGGCKDKQKFLIESEQIRRGEIQFAYTNELSDFLNPSSWANPIGRIQHYRIETISLYNGNHIFYVGIPEDDPLSDAIFALLESYCKSKRN